MRILIVAIFVALCLPFSWGAETSARPAKWSLYFSPHGGCTEAVVDALGKARSAALVQAYSFTSAPIAKALVEAHRRGVKVEVVLNRSQRTEKYSSATFIYNNGIPCFIDAQHANLLAAQDAQMAARYAQNWNIHRQHSEPYTGFAPGEEQSKPRSRKRQ